MQQVKQPTKSTLEYTTIQHIIVPSSSFSSELIIRAMLEA